MENNENVIDNEQNVDNFISQVKEMKENTVPKEDYEKLVDEKKKLMQALIDGNTDGIDLPDNSSDDELDKRIIANRTKLAKGEVANDLEYWETVLQLRNDVIEREGEERDPFLPNGHDYIYNENDAKRAKEVAKTVQECIDLAEGDSTFFHNELMRRVRDTSPIQPKKPTKR